MAGRSFTDIDPRFICPIELKLPAGAGPREVEQIEATGLHIMVTERANNGGRKLAGVPAADYRRFYASFYKEFWNRKAAGPSHVPSVKAYGDSAPAVKRQ